MALKPLAGKLSYLLFALGVIGTGLLSVLVLAESLSYILSETFEWKMGLDKKFSEAKGFYITLVISLVVGLFINLTSVTSFQSLFYTAALYGVTAPVLVAIIIHICNNRKIMGKEVNNRLSNFLGVIALLAMTGAVVALIFY